MPQVVRMGEQLFGLDEFYEGVEEAPLQNQLLSTIRVPKNLLYLTDRLPQPRYKDGNRIRNRSHEEESKRHAQEAGE